MPADALHYKFIAKELSDALTGGRIDKIAAVDLYTVRLCVYANGKTHVLLLSAQPARPRCGLTGAAHTESAAKPPFLAHLKKHLGGGRITEIEAVPNERILKFRVATKDELGFSANFTLIAEIMGKHSNLILTNTEGKITDSIKRIPLDVSSKRQVLPGLSYAPAPAQNKADPRDKAALAGVLTAYAGGDLENYLLKSLAGLSPAAISEAVYCAFLGDSTPIEKAEKLDPAQHNTLMREIERLFDPSELAPCVRTERGEISDFYIKPFRSCGGTYEKAATLNEAADRYYCAAERAAACKDSSRKSAAAIHAARVRAEKKLTALLEHAAAAQNFDDERIKGEILTANLYRVQPGDTVLHAENYYLSPPEPIAVPIEDGLSPAQAAQRYYKRYQKKKKTLESAAPQIKAAEEELDYLDSVSVSLSTAETLADFFEVAAELAERGMIREPNAEKKKSKGENRLAGVKRTEYEGYLVLTGKNNLQNDALVKSAAPNDVWLHTKNTHGAHTVIVNPKKTPPPERVVRYAAAVTALYSKAAASENVPVDYTYIKFVAKPRSAAPGKVVYTHQKTIYVTPGK